MGKCKFQNSWFTKTDGKGNPLRSWLKQCDEENAFCIFCSKKINFSLKGLQALQQHANGKKHQDKNNSSNVNQTVIKIVRVEDLDKDNNTQTVDQTKLMPANSLQLFSRKENSTKAEILWTLRAVVHNYSFQSCEGIRNTFEAMFPESFLDNSNNFSLSPKKMSYIITEALGPYFKEQFIEELQGKLNQSLKICYINFLISSNSFILFFMLR